ncbi:unnamed protein product [Nezara viridula]|uniref:MADF domain-containing protein n=1 Tax=Nezara viridula TaxID=85310 RepID=A0A9P0MV59_NEZVI|nr:unnamed protein product [Nezara viridula]
MPLDTERFIKEVEARPCLWNNHSPEYERKGLKTRGWKELCDIFVTNYPAMDSAGKNREVVNLQRKWKSLRNSFNRELKARRMGGEGSSRRPCQYFEQLSFLRPILEARMRNIPEQPAVEPSPGTSRTREEEVSEQEVPVHGVPCKRRRLCSPALEPSDHLHNANYCNGTDCNEVLFFHSLLPYFRRLTPTNKLNLKLAFMNLIKRYSKRKIRAPIVNEEEGSSRTTPAIINGTSTPVTSPSGSSPPDSSPPGSSPTGSPPGDQGALGEELEVEEEEEEDVDPEEEEEDDSSNYSSDTSPGLSAGYTDDSPETED